MSRIHRGYGLRIPVILIGILALAWTAELTQPLFEDAADATGLTFQHFIGATGDYFLPEILGSGVALLDYDGDGDLDVFVLQGSVLNQAKSWKEAIFPPPDRHFPGNRLFRNELNPSGRLSFTDVTEQSGLGSSGDYGMGAAVGDYDNDGHPDLFLTNAGGDRLFHNNGNGTFTDATATGLPANSSFGTSAAFVDYDQDGFLDLFVVRYNAFRVSGNKKCFGYAGEREYCGPGDYRPVSNNLYRNDRKGRFVDVTQAAGIASSTGNGLGVVCADFNEDGRIDIFVANDKTPNHMWINKGDGTFEDQALLAGAAYDEAGKEHAGMGVTAADINGDGRDDIFISNITGETHTLYLNLGRGLFQESSKLFGLGHTTIPYSGFGTLWFDYDNDGRPDLFIANGEVRAIDAQRGKPFPYGQKNLLFHNEGRRFRDVSSSAGPAFQAVEVSRGAAFGDIDNDGDIDIVVTNANGPIRLLRNQTGNRQHWLQVRLTGTAGNRDAYGARVALLRKGRTSTWSRVAADGSYLSASDSRVHFGLGTGADVSSSPPERILVVWPNGTRESWKVEKWDLLMKLREGSSAKTRP